VDKPEGKNRLGDLGIDGKITLQCILKKQDGKVQVGFIWLSIHTYISFHRSTNSVVGTLEGLLKKRQ
jgi:hypothetical protein